MSPNRYVTMLDISLLILWTEAMLIILIANRYDGLLIVFNNQHST